MVDWACGVYTAPVCLTCLSVLHNHACIRLRMGVCWCACCVDGVCAAASCATVSIASTALGLALESTEIRQKLKMWPHTNFREQQKTLHALQQ